MKALLVTLLIALVTTSFCFSQNQYETMFDELGYDQSLTFSTSNKQIAFSWKGGERLESLINMYELTSNAKYLETMIIGMSNIMDRRDDLRSSVGLALISDYRNIVGPVWSTNHYNKPSNTLPYAHVGHSGNITYPMAKFAQMVINGSSSLQNTVSPIFQNSAFSNEPGRYSNMTYLSIAHDIIDRIEETIAYHEDQWTESGNVGYYSYRCSDENYTVPLKHGECIILPLNINATIGRTLVQLYEATNSPEYLNKVYRLANFFKVNTKNDVNTSYKWRYYGNINGNYSTTVLRDDVSHSGLTVLFPLECYVNNVAYNGSQLFTGVDMEKYANTFAKNICQNNLKLNNGVDCPEQSWDFRVDDKVGFASSGTYVIYRWLYYAEINNDIYQQISDYYTSLIYRDGVVDLNHPLKLSLLAKFANHFVPLHIEESNSNSLIPVSRHGWGTSSNWSGVACGNFDADPSEEIVYMRNGGGSIFIGQASSATGIHNFAANYAYNSTYKWKGLAAGNFFGDAKSEFVTLSNSDELSKKGVYIFKVEGATITNEIMLPAWNGNCEFSGVTAGNFINGGTDEIIVVDDHQKELRLYKFQGTSLVLVNSLSLSQTYGNSSVSTLPDNSKIIGIVSGNFDGYIDPLTGNPDPEDEIVILVNSPGSNMNNGYYIYDVSPNGSMLIEIDKTVGWGTASDWNGIASGDFDGDGTDEFVVHRNADGDMYVRELCGTSLCSVATDRFPSYQNLNCQIAGGNIHLDSENDELIILRNSDGGMVSYTKAQVTQTSQLGKHLSELKATSVQSEISLEVYPNPTYQSIFVESALLNDEDVNYSVYTSSGVKVLDGSVSDKENQITLSHFEKGIYMIEFRSSNQTCVKRVVKL